MAGECTLIERRTLIPSHYTVQPHLVGMISRERALCARLCLMSHSSQATPTALAASPAFGFPISAARTTSLCLVRQSTDCLLETNPPPTKGIVFNNNGIFTSSDKQAQALHCSYSDDSEYLAAGEQIAQSNLHHNTRDVSVFTSKGIARLDNASLLY